MKHTIRKALCLFCAVALLPVLLTAAGCGSRGSRIRLCEVTHSIFYAPQYAALSLGFFADEGLDVELTNGQGADAVMAAVLSGSIDIGFAGPEASIYVYNEGKEDHTQVFAQVTRCDGSFLLARQPDEAFDWTKLRGKTLLPGRKGGVPYLTLMHVLRKNGLEPERDVTLDSSMQYSMMTAAFTGGTGDFVTAFEPTASMLQQQGKAYIVASVGEASGEIPYTAYFAKKSYLAKNADLVQRFTNALYRGQQWVAEHSAEEIADAVAGQFPDTARDLLVRAVESYRAIGAWNTDPRMTRASFDRLQEVMTAAGELTSPAPFDDVIDNSFAEAALSTGR